MAKKLKTDEEDFDAEVKRDGSDYVTPKSQRNAAHKYYHKNKDRITEERRHRFMTDPAFRAKVLRTKKKNIRVKQAREKARKEWIAPYLVDINGERIVVNMCNLRGLANFLGYKQSTVVRWMEIGTIPKGIWRTRGGYHLYTEFQAFFLKDLIENNKSWNNVGADRKILQRESFAFWKKWPYGFDLDDLEFEEDDG